MKIERELLNNKKKLEIFELSLEIQSKGFQNFRKQNNLSFFKEVLDFRPRARNKILENQFHYNYSLLFN